MNIRDRILIELDKIEKFALKYEAELRLLSKRIRRDIWKNNDEKVLGLLMLVNEVMEKKYSSRATCTYELMEDYVEALKRLGVIYIPDVNAEYYDRLADEIQLENARVIIEERWDVINSSPDSGKSFIEIFDDIFTKCIDNHRTSFFYPLKKSDILCRVVSGWGHDIDRFIPWPNKAQNRWNPPGRTYLYLSFSEEIQRYSDELTLSEYICLEEYRAQKGEKYSFCMFEPLVEGNILDLSYNDIDLATIRYSMDVLGRRISQQVMEDLTSNPTKLEHYKSNPKKLKREIKNKTEQYNDRSIIEDVVAKQYLKMVCNTIYKKVDEKDDAGKEKAYRSFQVLSLYLESKGVTGIIYPCTRTNKVVGKNLVLFNKEDAKPIKESIREIIY